MRVVLGRGSLSLHAFLSIALGDDVIISLENIEDCNRYLWGEVGGERVRKSVDKLLDMFQVERGTTLRPIMVSGERERERERGVDGDSSSACSCGLL